MRHLNEALTVFREINQFMPIVQAQCLLLVALHEGKTQKEIAELGGLGSSTLNRYINALGPRLRDGTEGANFIDIREDPMNARQKLCYLTQSGKHLVGRINSVLGT